jgi:hypothetical protein
MNRRWRPIVILGILAGVNLLIFSIECISLSKNPRTGPEGIERAFIVFACVGLSVLFAGVGLNQAFDNFKQKIPWGLLLLVSIFAAVPALFYVLFALIPTWTNR